MRQSFPQRYGWGSWTQLLVPIGIGLVAGAVGIVLGVTQFGVGYYVILWSAWVAVVVAGVLRTVWRRGR